jgi:hypothetical protein
MVWRTVLETRRAFEPGAWKMPMAMASLLFSIERRA